MPIQLLHFVRYFLLQCELQLYISVLDNYWWINVFQADKGFEMKAWTLPCMTDEVLLS